MHNLKHLQKQVLLIKCFCKPTNIQVFEGNPCNTWKLRVCASKICCYMAEENYVLHAIISCCDSSASTTAVGIESVSVCQMDTHVHLLFIYAHAHVHDMYICSFVQNAQSHVMSHFRAKQRMPIEPVLITRPS